MEKLKLSVAMCTYNGELYLPEQLKSIAEGNCLPYELVVCDDGSKDRTIEILNAFKKESPFPVTIVVNDKNLGSTKNFEKAINLCSGDIVALSDQDDVWYPHKLEKIKKVFEEKPETGVVFTDAHIVDKDLNPMGYTLWESIRFNDSQRELIRSGRATRVCMSQNVVTGATMAFKLKFKTEITPIPAYWIHDSWIAFIISAIADMVYIEEPLIAYRQHTGQQIGALKKEIKTNMMVSLKENVDWYKSQYKYLSEAYDRLKQYKHLIKDTRDYNEIRKILDHLGKRINLPGEKYKRLPVIITEVALLRYHRYSNGILSAAKDLFIN